LLRFSTTKQLFVYMRSGVDLEDTHARLERVKATYSDEKLSKYIDEELRPTIKYWANAHRVWNLTFGLTSSTMQENLHWSLKSKLRGCSVMAHMFRAFLVRVLNGRAVSVQRRQATVKPLKNLIRDLVVKGGRRLVNALETCVTKSGQSRLLMEFDLAEGRKSREIPWSEAAKTIQLMNDALLLQDGASWLRFTYLFEDAQDQVASRLFVVEMTEVDDDHPQRPHLVLVLPSGSVACSCGEVSAWGGFDRHVFHLVRTGTICFAPLVHLHPTYLVPGAKDLQDKSSFAVVPEGMTASSVTNASWAEAFEMSKERWDRLGLGKAARSTLRTCSQKAAAPKPTTMSRQEKMTKPFYRILDRANFARSRMDSGVYEMFMKLDADVDERAGLRAAEAFMVQGHMTRPPAPLMLESSNPKKSSSAFRRDAASSSSKKQKK